LKQALTYITDYAGEPPTILDICQAAGVSQRTLEYAFLERFGVTPKTYLQAYRLNGVRKTLRQADPEATKIVDVANRWGFWHMGQFARDYQKLSGELPSETLRH
jgi:AraC family ethanolamine operon transcriptional activator